MSFIVLYNYRDTKIDADGIDFLNYIIKIFRKHLSCVLHAVKIILIVPAEIAAASSLNAATVLTSTFPATKAYACLHLTAYLL